jgi:hypothetical protein
METMLKIDCRDYYASPSAVELGFSLDRVSLRLGWETPVTGEIPSNAKYDPGRSGLALKIESQKEFIPVLATFLVSVDEMRSRDR